MQHYASYGLIRHINGLTLYGSYLWVYITEIREADAKNYGENAKK